jgi:UDP-hydrolysing UDP-N-acetyl-D-glucosamine 2-epimerase
MSKRIGIFTTTRAEFGLYLPLLKKIEQTSDLEYALFVGGTHLAPEHGCTMNEIKAQNIPIADTFDYVPNLDSSFALAHSVGVATIQLSYIFKNYHFDMVMVLGDRYELLSIIQNAILFKKPIIHLYGGEKTEGAMDEQIRHMVSKAAHLHFVSCQTYAQNLLSLGENPWRIHNVGSLATDNMSQRPKSDRQEIFERLRLNPSLPTILMTYHPVTLDLVADPETQIENVFKALKISNHQMVITAPNVDDGREKIMNIISKEVQNNSNYKFIQSLGAQNYHALIPHCQFVIGNSSSGIVEVPYYKIPTINVGDRQKGRVRHPSIIDTTYSVSDIMDGIQKATSAEFIASIRNMEYQFGDGTAAEKIVCAIKETEIDQRLIRKSLEN